jgi:hypothetical protein
MTSDDRDYQERYGASPTGTSGIERVMRREVAKYAGRVGGVELA